MSINRRKFLKGTAATFAAVSIPSTLKGIGNGAGYVLIPSAGRWNDPDLFTLAESGVDIAMSLGAQYADVRLTNTRNEEIRNYREIAVDDEWFGIGVRVLVKGHWGFMSSAVWTLAEVERLARGAVTQASAYSQYIKGTIELAQAPSAVNRGEWSMPIKYDPFDVPKGEKMDFLSTFFDEVAGHDPVALAQPNLLTSRNVAVFASSNNSQWKQTTYSTELAFGVTYSAQASLNAGPGNFTSHIRPAMGKGWEYIIETDMFSELFAQIEEAKAARYSTPVEINRYDAVLAPRVVAGLLGATLGAATELDRALGYEANASGTSFLDSPLEMAGEYRIGSTELTVVADRTVDGGLNTVKWDDEAVPVQPTVLIQDGVVVDFQTTRETSTHLAPYYKKIGKSLASNGSASAQSGLFVTTQHTSNLRMNPGKEDLSFNDLVSKVDKGVAIVDIHAIDMDQQCLNGTISCRAREIRNGKMERYIDGAGIMIRTPDFWKNMAVLGGPSTQKMFSFTEKKGQPAQSKGYSASAVPALFRNLGMMNYKAR